MSEFYCKKLDSFSELLTVNTRFFKLIFNDDLEGIIFNICRGTYNMIREELYVINYLNYSTYFIFIITINKPHVVLRNLVYYIQKCILHEHVPDPYYIECLIQRYRLSYGIHNHGRPNKPHYGCRIWIN